MNSDYHPRLQGTPNILKPLNPHRLHVIRLSMLSAFSLPGTTERQQEVPFKEYHDRVNAALHFEHAQVMGVTARHLLFQMRWFEKRGIMYPKPSGDPNARFDTVILSSSARLYFSTKTPEEILAHFEAIEPMDQIAIERLPQTTQQEIENGEEDMPSDPQ